MERYEDVAKVVKPKQAALAEAQGQYNEVMVALNIKQVCGLDALAEGSVHQNELESF